MTRAQAGCFRAREQFGAYRIPSQAGSGSRVTDLLDGQGMNIHRYSHERDLVQYNGWPEGRFHE